MNTLRLVRIGEAPLEQIEALAVRLQSILGAPVDIGDLSLDPTFAFEPSRGQFDSRRLLAALEALDRAEGERIVGVADLDLYASIFTFVFGEAHLGGSTAIVSMHRLRSEMYGLAADPFRLVERLTVECVHEIGHLLGAVHCNAQGCVMNFSGVVEEIDLKTAAPCEDCRRLLLPRTNPAEPGQQTTL